MTDELAQPKSHFRLERPADLSSEEAEAIYRRIADDGVRSYRLSGNRTAEVYLNWQRFNRVPYRSATHGERFVNNYGNAKAAGYGALPDGQAMPNGAILAKDSFAVTDEGEVFTGPLFLMEKMAPGFNPQSRDWRYTMIMPDGSLFGTTNGQDSARVSFCISCHEGAGADNDHLFFVPPAYRIETEGSSALSE